MNKRDKIKKGIECCLKCDFEICMDFICPYRPKASNNFSNCRYELLSDTLDLLNEDLHFTVIDKKTGEYPDISRIAQKEKWAEGLCYCDMDGFAIEEDGTLLLLDECGRLTYCPSDRFEIKLE